MKYRLELARVDGRRGLIRDDNLRKCPNVLFYALQPIYKMAISAVPEIITVPENVDLRLDSKSLFYRVLKIAPRRGGSVLSVSNS